LHIWMATDKFVSFPVIIFIKRYQMKELIRSHLFLLFWQMIIILTTSFDKPSLNLISRVHWRKAW
jgi:hypothetical protein